MQVDKFILHMLLNIEKMLNLTGFNISVGNFLRIYDYRLNVFSNYFDENIIYNFCY